MARWVRVERGHELDLEPLLGAGTGPRRARAVKLLQNGWAALLVWDTRTHLRLGNLASAAEAQRAALEEARRICPDRAPVLDELVRQFAAVV